MSHKDLNIKKSKIFKEVLVFKPSVHYDERGTLFTTYNKDVYGPYLRNNLEFIHDKFAESKNNVLRGLHGDNKTWKLISCIKGEIFQVVVDYREKSNTYMKWDSWVLNDKNKLQILVPPGFVNGYYVMSESAVFHYKLAYHGEYLDAKDQYTVRWNSPEIDIDWPSNNPLLQDRDK